MRLVVGVCTYIHDEVGMGYPTHTHMQKKKKKEKKVCMFGERSEVVNHPEKPQSKNISTLKNHHSICLGNHTMVEKPYYGREGRANQCCSGIVEKFNHQCLEKNNSGDKKLLRNW